mmetsp:Transcript_2752/g.5319  ORF Transcript_2752/g.5319 Transcript_2752/m.5319 type:complete len:427 (-) Transcript_2752:15-1295(-)
MDRSQVKRDLERLSGFTQSWPSEGNGPTNEPQADADHTCEEMIAENLAQRASGSTGSEGEAEVDTESREKAYGEEVREPETPKSPRSAKHQAAQEFAPALADLQQAKKDLEQLLQAVTGVKNKLSHTVVSLKAQGIISLDETSKARVRQSCALETFEPTFELPFDKGALKTELSQATSPEMFCNLVDDFLSKHGELDVPVDAFCTKSTQAVDTTHQDTRDVERDEVKINGTIYKGAEAKYEGIVEKVQHQVEEALEWTRACAESPSLDSILKRFARVILCAGNRTHSGGNTYEVIMKLFGGSDWVLVTPDSEGSEPIQIELTLDSFKKVSDIEPKSVYTAWGVVARISAITKYHLKDPEDVENSLLGITGQFTQVLALALPFPRVMGAMAEDDGRSIHNRQDYTVWENAASHCEGYVKITRGRIVG